MVPGLYSLFLKRLCEIKPKKEIIPYELVFSKICRSFSITKDECRLTLMFFAEMHFIEIHKKGIKILKKDVPKRKELKLFAKDIPKSCTNKCYKCHKDFEAEISIEETCDKCLEEINKRVQKKVKEEVAKGNPNPEWVIRFQELIKEYE